MEIFGATLECGVSLRQMYSCNMLLSCSDDKMLFVLQMLEDR